MTPFQPTARRRFLRMATLLGLGAGLGTTSGALAARTPQTVTVLTSYPDEFVSRIEAAFEKAHPEYRLRIVWRMPDDAAAYLQQVGHGGADVYWSASPRTFARLASDGVWRKLPVDLGKLPRKIGNTALGDKDGYYTASEVAGYGFAVSPKLLAERKLPTPAAWEELADPRYAGLIAVPIPARVGFAPPLVEILLQSYGWERGWALWSEISANAVFVERGSTFITDKISAGRCAIGLSIDFFVNSAIANGTKLEFVYPPNTGINPAHIAVTRDCPNATGSQAFVAFVLSAGGQKLLAHPDIRRLPVRPDVYAELPKGYFNPFAATAAGKLPFDSDAARPRLATSAAIFQQMLVEPHDELKTLWQRLHASETAGQPLAKVRELLGTPPLDEAAASAGTVQRQVGPRPESDSSTSASALELSWRDTCQSRRDTARHLLAAADA